MTYPRNARLTESEWAEYKSLVEGHYAKPGHDLDCALAMLSQSNLRHPASPISPTQVLHLLQIGYTAGWAVGKKVDAEAHESEVQRQRDQRVLVAEELARWQNECVSLRAKVAELELTAGVGP